MARRPTAEWGLKLYSVHVRGYEPYRCAAASSSKARFCAYRAFREAFGNIDFRDFLDRLETTLHLGPAPEAKR